MFGKCSLGVEEDLRNTAQLPPALKLQSRPPVKLASAQLERDELMEEEEKSLGG